MAGVAQDLLHSLRPLGGLSLHAFRDCASSEGLGYGAVRPTQAEDIGIDPGKPRDQPTEQRRLGLEEAKQALRIARPVRRHLAQRLDNLLFVCFTVEAELREML